MSFNYFLKLLIPVFSIFIHGFTCAQTTPGICGTDDSIFSADLLKFAKKKDLTALRTSSEEKLEYRLALNIDYKTYLIYNGNKELITKTAYKFIGDASEIFEREINIKLTVTSILIWDRPEPFQLVTDEDYFYNVLNYWTNNRSDNRDAVVSLVSKYGTFYGSPTFCSSNFPTPDTQSMSVDILCHELGHTLGSPHTHSCNWPGGPIDQCRYPENTSSECPSTYVETLLNGTLMSYCMSVLSFHPLCRNLMRSFAQGDVNTSFKLNPLKKATISGPISVNGNVQALSNVPTFRWSNVNGADKFRLQLSRDSFFKQIIADTLTKYPIYQSRGLLKGTYFARVCVENTGSPAEWSQVLTFTVPPLSAASIAEAPFNVMLNNDFTFSGNFYNYDDFVSYKLLVTDSYYKTQVFHEGGVSKNYLQSFKFPFNFNNLYNFYSVRLSVQKDNAWSQWSDPVELSMPGTGNIGRTTNLSKVSASPVISTSLDFNTRYPSELRQSIEVSTDEKFSALIYKDSILSNSVHTPKTTRSVFQPPLNENSLYYVRTRINWSAGMFSGWDTKKLTTGVLDTRFNFVGIVSPDLQYPGYYFDNGLKNKFYKAGNKLYVIDREKGYFVSNDAKNWQSYTIRSTKGQSPNQIVSFGISQNGDIFTMDRLLRILKNKDGVFSQISQYLPSARIPELDNLIITENGGMFFKSDAYVVSQFLNGSWQHYDAVTLKSNRAIALLADSQNQVWAVMEGGGVWIYKNGNWILVSTFPNSSGLRGAAFDNNQRLYLYGDWGVSRFAQSQNKWETITSLNGFPARKIIFDKTGQMWVSSYSSDNEHVKFAVIKYKDQKTSIYSDGLNFSRESFDIEIFNDKVLILTAGGEVYEFDETKIQGFDPDLAYCSGSEITVKIGSNSTFDKDNKIRFSVSNTEKTDTINLTTTFTSDNVFKMKLPDVTGSYKLRTYTTHPEIVSNESKVFKVISPDIAKITAIKSYNGETILKASEGTGFTYQWQLDGTDIANANDETLIAKQSGNYSVVLKNQGGCRTTSDLFSVEIDKPAEIILLQNVPNPVSNHTQISFFLPNAETVNLDYYNISGIKMGQLKQGYLQPGWHVVNLDANTLFSGVYIYRLRAGSFDKALKLIR